MRVQEPRTGGDALDHDVVAGPAVQHVGAAASEEHVVTLAAEQRVVAGAAEEHVVAVAAGGGQERGVGGQARGVDDVVADQGVDRHPVTARDGPGDRDARREAGDLRGRAGAGDRDGVVAVGRVDHHVVRCGVVAAAGRGQVGGHVRDVGPGQVVDGEQVGAAERVGDDRLDVVEVHDDVRDVAGEPDAVAVGGRLHALVGVAAVEPHRVGAVLPLDHVAGIAGIPLEGVVAGAEERDVVALLAVGEVVAVAAEQHVGAVGAEEVVVAGAAVGGDLDQRGQVAGGREAVVAAVGVEDEVLGRADVDRERGRVEAVEPDASAVGRCRELLEAVTAVDLDRVGAGRAFVEVRVVAGVPDHAVVAALAERLVVGVAAGQRVVVVAAEQQVEAALAEQRVVAALAEQLVVPGAGGQDVVPGAAEQLRRRQGAVDLADGEGVVAAQAEHLDQRGVGDRRCTADDSDRTAVDQDRAGGVAADGDVVRRRVAGHAQRAVTERRGCRRARGHGRGGEDPRREYAAGQQPARDMSGVVLGHTPRTPIRPGNSRIVGGSRTDPHGRGT